MSDPEKKAGSDKWDLAVTALLTERTHEGAAKKVGIGSATLRRWFSEPSFQKKYRNARFQVFEQAITQLTAATLEAVETLRRNLSQEKPEIQVRAATAILDLSMKGRETIDLEERLSAIEEAVSRGGGGGIAPILPSN